MQRNPVERLQEKEYIADLLDIYGKLLTDRQRDFLELYYNEDLSYGEIAETEEISRQAVHDAIQHGKKALIKFESHLHLTEQRDVPSTQVSSAPSEVMEDITHMLLGLYRYIQNEDIIYDTRRIKNQLKEILQKLGSSETSL